MKCPKCQSPNVYQQDGENACQMCGERWPITIPVSIRRLSNSKGQTNMATKENRKKPCRNCERNMIVLGDGLCGGCYYTVKNSGFVKGTPEYDTVLAAAKERFSNPDHKKPSGRRKSKTLSPKIINKLKTKAKVLFKIKHNGGDPEMSGVITTMQMERERLLAKAEKLTQAIELLQ